MCANMKANWSLQNILIVVLVGVIVYLFVFNKPDNSGIDALEKQMETVKLEKEQALDRAKFISDSTKESNIERTAYWEEQRIKHEEELAKQRAETEKYRQNLAKVNKRIKKNLDKIKEMEENPPTDDPIDLVRGLQKDVN